jgi:hypothetical protein
MAKYLSSLLFLVDLSVQIGNPLSDFCRRFGHQTTVIDRKLYIDGGLLNWNPIAQYPQNYTSQFSQLSYLPVQNT